MIPTIRIAIILLFTFPFIYLLSKVSIWSVPPATELLPAIQNTFLQSSLSATLALFFGFIGALGLIGVKRQRAVIELLLLAPTFFPTLFVLLACLQILNPFPYGMTGVILVHVVIYSGLMTVMIARLLESQIGGFAELALIEGATKFKFMTKGVLPYIAKDLLLLFAYVFAMAASSFSIPLMVGGRGIATLEMLIYEKVIIESNFSQAVAVSVVQFLLLFGLSQISRTNVSDVSKNKNLNLLSLRFLHVPIVVLSLAVVVSNVFGIFQGVQEIERINSFSNIFFSAASGTFLISIMVALFIFLLLMVTAFCFPHRGFESFLQSFAAPSTAIFGVVFFRLGGGSLAQQSEIETIVKISFAFCLIVFCGLYRLRWSSRLESLRGQILISRTLGANPIQIFSQVIFPQVLSEAFVLTGLAAFWACGDFALSQMISAQPISLSLVASQLMGSYRFEGATILIWSSLMIGGFIFIFNWGLSRVAYKKYLS